jgi:hypothetical protein
MHECKPYCVQAVFHQGQGQALYALLDSLHHMVTHSRYSTPGESGCLNGHCGWRSGKYSLQIPLCRGPWGSPFPVVFSI